MVQTELLPQRVHPVEVGSRRHGTGWRLAALAEVALSAAAVFADLLVPAVLLFVLACLSLLLRREASPPWAWCGYAVPGGGRAPFSH
ncbi:MAG: hypothetical protein J2P22_16890 [Nocardioides sp.]|nr:hypothetical protein [Nocardioides sp.]